MNDKNNPNLEELLSGYIDGELNERQLTEIKRLIARDEQIAAKLHIMQKTKQMLGILPESPAPPEILQGVMQRMKTKAPKTEHPAIVAQRRAGERHLMLRRTLAAAAMLALISVLALLVYNILKPVSPAQPQPVAELTRPEPGRFIVSETPPEVPGEIPAAAGTVARKTPRVDILPVVLELQTTEPRSLNAAIARAIYDSGLLECTNIQHLQNQDVYSLNCDRISTAALAADLKGLWERTSRTNLSLAQADIEQRVTIHNVTAEQVATILTQQDMKNRAKLAKDFAALNTMAAVMPGRGILNGIQGEEYNLLKVDKPVLTSGRDLRSHIFPETEQAEKISFTIIVKPAE